MPASEPMTSRCPIFDNLTPEEREQVSGLMERTTYPRGETILREGRSIQILWLIVEGRCEVIKTTGSGDEQQLAVLEPGAIFGEVSFFQPAPHSASIRALTEVEVTRLPREKYDRLCELNPAAAHKITYNTAAILADRLRKMDDWVGQLVQRPDGARHREEWHEFRTKLYSDWEF